MMTLGEVLDDEEHKGAGGNHSACQLTSLQTTDHAAVGV
jgi:hypothetical protein